MQEQLEKDPTWSFTILRCFHVLGAHESGHLGHNPAGLALDERKRPYAMMPNVVRAASGIDPTYTIYGGDYSTADGTQEIIFM
jgi:UDP-glucose 4-epimerase